MMPQELFSAKSCELDSQLDSLKQVVMSALKEHRPIHETEEQVLRILLELGRASLGLLFKSLGPGDVGATHELADGRTVKRLGQHPRRYLSIFGEFELSRFAYGARVGRKQEFIPLDETLALPESKFSYLLQDWDQSLSMEQPFAKVSDTLAKILGLKQHVDSLERMNRDMAKAVEPYETQLTAPPASEEGELLVQTADCKGVPIRRSADTSSIEDHRSKRGPKPDRKKMATLGSVYSIDRFRRTPEEVVESLFRDPQAPRDARKRPRPQHKRVQAKLNLVIDGEETIRAAPAIFGWMADEIGSRNPGGKKEVVCIMDGQPSLWEDRDKQWDSTESIVDILDLLHVTPRIWKAAHLFHRVDSDDAKQFVRQRVLRILRGEVSSVVRGLRRLATTRKLSDQKRTVLERICNYFLNNAHRMRYSQYLKQGYPIASGVIEGACRNVVKDRLERTGMTWTIEGATAMLGLRCIHLSDQWDDYVKFRVEREIKRLYPDRKNVTQLQFELAA